MQKNILITGGGLAGLTAAIHLSRQGFDVTIIEKNSYPHHKVCGEYIPMKCYPTLIGWMQIRFYNWMQPISPIWNSVQHLAKK